MSEEVKETLEETQTPKPNVEEETSTEQEEVKAETTQEEVASENSETTMDKLRKKFKKDNRDLELKITELEGQVANLKNEYAKAYADTENTRRRLQNDFDSRMKYRIQSFALEVLPVLDNLERAMAQPVPEGAESYAKGVQMTYEQLVTALKKEGVEEIDCCDAEFDGNYHQAIMSEKVEGIEPGKVTAVLQKGYTLKDRILRAAMVKVSE